MIWFEELKNKLNNLLRKALNFKMLNVFFFEDDVFTTSVVLRDGRDGGDLRLPTFEKIFQRYKDKPRFVEDKIKFLGRDFIVPDSPSFAWQVKEIFSEEEYKFASENNNPLIYDCGANIGVSVLYFKNLYPRAKIKAFEADKKIYNILQYNLNKIIGDDVEIFQNAVWIKNDELTFNSEGADGGSLINNFNDKTKVKAIRLKELLSNEKRVDFLKMDIEGAETEVLIDCEEELQKVDKLFVEYHSFVNKPQTLDVILKIITNAGFRYHINVVSLQKEPFITRTIWSNMDLQCNIFAYRESHVANK